MTVESLTKDIEACFNSVDDIWAEAKKKYKKNPAKPLVMKKIREIHFIMESAFLKLWNEYCEDGLPEEEIEKIDMEYDPWGRIRFVYCDGLYHFKTTKRHDLIYACKCDC